MDSRGGAANAGCVLFFSDPDIGFWMTIPGHHVGCPRGAGHPGRDRPDMSRFPDRAGPILFVSVGSLCPVNTSESAGQAPMPPRPCPKSRSVAQDYGWSNWHGRPKRKKEATPKPQFPPGSPAAAGPKKAACRVAALDAPRNDLTPHALQGRYRIQVKGLAPTNFPIVRRTGW